MGRVGHDEAPSWWSGVSVFAAASRRCARRRRSALGDTSPAAMSRASWRRSVPASASSAASAGSANAGRRDQGAGGQVEPRAGGQDVQHHAAGEQRRGPLGLVGVGDDPGGVEDRHRAAADDPQHLVPARRPPRRRRCPRRRRSRAAAATGRRSSAAGRSGCAGRSAGRSPHDSSRPRPAATWVIRCLGVDARPPKATMCEDWMLAPAEVPATTAPRWCASTIASPNGVPLTTADSLSWLPPVMKIPVALSSSATRSGSCASSRLSGRTRDDLGGAQLAEQGVVHLDDLGPERRRGRR